MTEKACLNCHGSQETYPFNYRNQLYRSKPGEPGTLLPWEPTPLLETLTQNKCSAKDHWTESLKLPQGELQQLPFWVRSNYETTLKKSRQARGELTLPFRLVLGAAHFSAEIKPKNFIASIFIKGKEIPIFVDSHREGALRSNIQIEENLLDLGIQNYLRGDGVVIGVRTPLDHWFRPGFELNKIGLGFEGAPHLLGRPNSHLLQVMGLTDKIPFAPPHFRYYDDPSCYLFNLLPQCGSYLPFGDIWLPDAVPQELTVGNFQQLKMQWPLESFLLQVLRVLDRKKQENLQKDPKEITEFGNLLSPFFFKPGTHLTLNLEDLRDFFIAEKLDLGPSQGRLQLRINEKNHLQLAFEDFYLTFDAMEFPFPQEDQKRGTLKIKDMQVTPGKFVVIRPDSIAAENLFSKTLQPLGEDLPPGLILTQNYQTQNWSGTLNLNVFLNLQDGKELSGQVLAKIEMLDTKEGLKLSPNIYFELQNFKLSDANGKDLVKSLDLVFDGPYHDFETETPPFKRFFFNRAQWKAQIALPQGKKLSLQGNTDLPLVNEESLDIENFLHQVALLALIEWEDPKGSDFQFKFDLNSILPSEPNHYAYQGQIEASRTPQGKELPTPLLAPGHFGFNFTKNPEGPMSLGLFLNAPRFQWSDLGDKDLLFNGMDIALRIPELIIEEDLKKLRVSEFKISLNEQGSDAGWVQGPIEINQKTDQAFEISYQPKEKDLHISGLDWKLNAQKIYLPPKVRRIFRPGTQSLGIDGRLKVDFDLDMSQPIAKWQGNGSVLLAGDPQGDIYPLDAAGRINGVPLLRKSHWEWSKLTHINVARGYLLGQGHLRTWINLGSLGEIYRPGDLSSAQYEGIPISSDPYELRVQLFYNNQPWAPQGFRNREEDYLIEECRQSEWCAPLLNQVNTGAER